MCCCGKAVVNGEMGYRWQPNDAPSIRPVNAPELTDASDSLIFDEPGRCGGLDSHCHHYRVVLRHGTTSLFVRHGGGDERIRLSAGENIIRSLAALDSNARYWLLNAVYHAHADGVRTEHSRENSRWMRAAAEKRIRTRKRRGQDTRVWIEPLTCD